MGSMGDDTPMAVLSSQGPLALRLFPPAVRAGDEPADRSAARADRDVAADEDRAASATCSTSAPEHAQPGHHELAGAVAAQAAPAGRPRHVQGPARIHQPQRRREPADPGGAGCHLRAGGGSRAEGRADRAAERPLSRTRQTAGARAARDRRSASPPRPEGTALRLPTSSSRPAPRATRITSPASSATAPPPCIRTGVPDAVRHDAQARASSTRRAHGARPQLPARHPQGAASRSCRRWASRRSPATAARSSSRSSGCRREIVDAAASAARESRIQGADFEDLQRRPESARRTRVGAARAARARAACSSTCTAASTTVQPGRDRDAAGGGAHRRVTRATRSTRSS